MSVSTFNNLMAKLGAPTQRLPIYKSSNSPAISALCAPTCSCFTDPGYPLAGSIPGAASIPTNATAGAIGQNNKAGTEQRAWLRRFDESPSVAQATPPGGMLILVDRLAHMGGLSGTVTTAQTVSLGSLTRYTSGVGVWAACQIYTAVGATGTTLTASYTNTVPTSGLASPAIVFGGAGYDSARRILPIPVAIGDIGVTAVASVTVLATTGTAGSFGVSLYKTLGMWPVTSAIPQALSGMPLPNFGHLPVIQDNSCLELLFIASGAGSTTLLGAEFCTFED